MAITTGIVERLRRHRVDQARVASSRPRSARGHVQRVGGHARGRGIPWLHRCHRSRLRHARRPSVDVRPVFLAVPHTAALKIGAATRRARRDGGRPVGRLPAEDTPPSTSAGTPRLTRRPTCCNAPPSACPSYSRRSLARRGRPCGGRGRARGLRGLLSHGHVARGGTAVRAGLSAADAVVVVDAISGVTGAGKKASARTHFASPTRPRSVRRGHAPPRPRSRSWAWAPLVFTPHLAPLNRGLLSTDEPAARARRARRRGRDRELYRTSTPTTPSSTCWTPAPCRRPPRWRAELRARGARCQPGGAHALVAVGAIDNLGRRGQPGRAVRERGAGLAPDPRARNRSPFRVTRTARATHQPQAATERSRRPTNRSLQRIPPKAA